MEKISNRTIAMLLIATIAIYLGGTFISLNKLADVGYMSTGLAIENETGQVQLEIQSLTDIVWIVDAVDWGTGYVDSSCNNCTLFVNGTNETGSVGLYDSTCCTTFSNANSSLILRNQGNQDVSLGFNISSDSDDWFGTDTPRNLSFQIVPSYLRAITANYDDVADTTDACTGNSTHDGGWSFDGVAYNTSGNAAEDLTVWRPLDVFVAAPILICGGASAYNFTSTSSANEISFDFKVVIPQAYTGTGAKTASITAQGTN